MKAVVAVESGVLELNYLWLPTFIGMNSVLKQEMEKALADKLQGLPMDAAGLDKAHDIVVDFLEQRFPDIRGLGRFLDAMKYIEIG